MTGAPDEAVLRHWLADYLVTNLGCSPDEIDFDASMHDLGVGSRDSVVLTGELSELLGRTISPVEFWQYPTIDALARFLSGGEPESAVETKVSWDQRSMDEPIAVIGLGCRFPGDIHGPESLWQFLCDGQSAVGEVPPDRWASFDDGSPEVSAALADTTRWGSFLTEVDAFDAEFFEIIPREAAKMDPQQRLLLEVVHEALEHAGIPADSLRQTQTGVFAGACQTEYGYLASTDLSQVDAWSGTGGALSIIANRVSYFFDLRGPSVTVDTACSSSLVAVHLACQSLRAGDSNLAFAAGVNLLLSPAVTRSFDEAQMMSPTGQCHAFDASADGFVRGEGCGVAVLKRLSDALRDGDRVLAVVRGSAVNQDGRSNGIMAPNPAAQMAVLRAAYANAGVEPREVGYVEAHGTGTLLGDTVEARALGTVLGRGRPANSPLLIGAVKSNLGHLEAASGIAGFLKAVLAVQRGRIPANQNFQTPNPHIPFENLRLKVVAEHTDWPSTDSRRRAGVSTFGFGGTNAHVVLEQGPGPAPTAATVPQTGAAVTTLVVSGKTPDRIASMAGVLADWMDGDGADVALPEVAHTLNHHRATRGKFATVCARDRAQAVAGLHALAVGHPAEGVVGPHEGRCAPSTVFVYSGQGSQWTGMARRLLDDEPAFGSAIAEIEPAFVAEFGFSLQQVLAGTRRAAPNGAADASDRSRALSRRAAARLAARAGVRAVRDDELRGDARVQPVLMGLQLGLTELWRSYGVHPDAVIGYSMGEIAAAVVAGALTVTEGLRVIAVRSRLMSRLAGQGAVALLELDAEATAELIADHPEVTLAAYASPRQTAIAGPPAQIDGLITEVQRRDRFARRVNMEVASHNPIMDPILPELRASLVGLAPKIATIPLFTTVYDNPSATPVFDAEYWAANVRNPVRFTRAVTLAGTNHHTFIEISPHPMTTHAIGETLAGTHHHSIGTLRQNTDDTRTFHANLNAVHTIRPPHTPHPPEPHVVLPSSPWHRTRYWMSATPRRWTIRHTETVQVGHDRLDANDGTPPDWRYELTWPVRPLAGADTAADGSWLVLANGDLGAEIERAIGGDSRVKVLAPSFLATDRDSAALSEALRGISNVLYAPDVSSTHVDVESGYSLFNTGRTLAAALAATPSPPRLFMLTRNAQPLLEGDRANPAHAVLWGLGRTLMLQHSEMWGRIIDLDDLVPAELAANCVLAEASAADGEDQVVYRAGVRHVPRLRRQTPPATSLAVLDKDTSHLVVGPIGNMGPHLIQQLADMGAGTIVAVSRNPGLRLDKLSQTLSSKGTKLVTVAADAADEAAMKTLFDRFGTDLPPIDGIYLAPFAGRPTLLGQMSDDLVKEMFRPNLDAASLLHKLSLKTSLRQFVLFSSISGLLGSPLGGHYAAANTFLDTLAYARRSLGLAATVVDWGAWKSLAEAESDAQRRDTLESLAAGSGSLGLMPMSDEVAIRALSSAMAPGSGVRSVVAAADWILLATTSQTHGPVRMLEELQTAEDTAMVPEGDFRENLRKCRPERHRDMLVQHIGTVTAWVMGLPQTESLDPSTGFIQLGMNSLTSLLLQRTLSQTLGQTLPASLVFDYPTVEAVADYLATRLPEMIQATDQNIADAHGNPTEDELLRQPSERASSQADLESDGALAMRESGV
jgi:phthiocerol/phenolphthiocerol synthesis type-I polyketide synthase B